MKSRETVLRLKRFQVDEKRRRVAQIELMIAEFERIAGDLEREIKTEQDRAGIHDPTHFAYPTYAKAAMQRRENLKRSAGIHAAGVVIGRDPLVENVPLRRGDHGEVVTQYDMKGVEELGLLKIDFLGLRNLTVIDLTRDYIKANRGTEVDVVKGYRHGPGIAHMIECLTPGYRAASDPRAEGGTAGH